MARSHKDGRRRGGHLEARRTGKEYWSARPGGSMGDWGSASKDATHRAERRVKRADEFNALREPAA